MKILIIETCLYHLEIFPSWEKILEGHDLCFLYRKKIAKKLKVKAIMNNKSRHYYTSSPPLSRNAHEKLVKKINPDLVIYNTGEIDKRAMDPNLFFRKFGVPVIVLCHNRKSLEIILSKQELGISGCVLSPKLTDSSYHFIHATDFGSARPQKEEDLERNDQLVFIVPGRVNFYIRNYKYLDELAAKLAPKDKIILLGDATKVCRGKLKDLLAKHKNIHHVGKLNSPSVFLPYLAKGLSFHSFTTEVLRADAILPLIDSDLDNYKHYKDSVQSGNINLSIGLQKPLFGHPEYFESIPYLDENHYEYCVYGDEKVAIDRLRKSIYLKQKNLREKQIDLLEISRMNINRIIDDLLNNYTI